MFGFAIMPKRKSTRMPMRPMVNMECLLCRPLISQSISRAISHFSQSQTKAESSWVCCAEKKRNALTVGKERRGKRTTSTHGYARWSRTNAYIDFRLFTSCEKALRSGVALSIVYILQSHADRNKNYRNAAAAAIDYFELWSLEMGDACNVAATLIVRWQRWHFPTHQPRRNAFFGCWYFHRKFTKSEMQKPMPCRHRRFHFSHSPGCRKVRYCVWCESWKHKYTSKLIHLHNSRHKAVFVTRTAADDDKKEWNCVSLCVTQRRQRRRWLPTDIFSAFNVLARARDSIFVGRCNALDKKDEWLFVYPIGVWVGLCSSKMYHPSTKITWIFRYCETVVYIASVGHVNEPGSRRISNVWNSVSVQILKRSVFPQFCSMPWSMWSFALLPFLHRTQVS